MNTAGIDFGSTLTKAYWRRDRTERSFTASDEAGRRELAERLREDDVKKIRRAGIGKTPDQFERRFIVQLPPVGAVDDEILLQALGARLLMERGGFRSPRKMIVAAVGTGVSYAVVKGRKAKRHALGSCHGGGTIMGLAGLLGLGSFQELEAAAAKGAPADLLVKDQLPDTAGTPLGELVIAHFCKAGASLEDKSASVFSFAAASIAKDLAVLTSIPFSPKDVAVVGTVAASTVFQRHLKRWLPMLKGCTVRFPDDGQYAAAIGAWADISS